MESMELFSGISDADLTRLLRCLDARRMFFPKSQTIMTCQNSLQKIGVLLAGKAHLYCIDSDGSYSLLEHISHNDVFGELFALPIANWEYIVEADTDCEVLFLPYENIIRRCPNACDYHSRLVDNLFHLSTQKSQALALRINLLSTKTIRQKLISYFSGQAARTGSSTFRMDMTLTDLAEYLCVDRSSLMRELRILKDEGILESKGRIITMNE